MAVFRLQRAEWEEAERTRTVLDEARGHNHLPSLRCFARGAEIDPANLNRVLKGRSKPSRLMMAKMQALLAEESERFAFTINALNSLMEVTVSRLLWAMAWQLTYRGTRSVSESTSLSYSEMGLMWWIWM